MQVQMAYIQGTQSLVLCEVFYLKKKLFGVPHLATCIFLFFYNEPELGVGIDPGMALTPFPSSIGRAGIEPTTF